MIDDSLVMGLGFSVHGIMRRTQAEEVRRSNDGEKDDCMSSSDTSVLAASVLSLFLSPALTRHSSSEGADKLKAATNKREKPKIEAPLRPLPLLPP